MFEYFPDNYNWSLAVSLAIAMGGEISEIDSACRPLRGLAATAVDDATQQAWFDSWTATADRLDELAARDEAASRWRSAARKRLSVDHRFAACVAWGAFHDLLGVAANLAQTGAHSAPPFQVPWVFGMEEERLRNVAPCFNLDAVIAEMTCPLLVVHGESDRQVPVAQARRTYDKATSSSRRDLLVFPKGAWGEEHCQVDDPTLAIDTIGDWLQEVLG